MVNLGICRKCPKCSSFSAALVNDRGDRVRSSFAECIVSGTQELCGWDSEIPDGCPYVLEHTLMGENVNELAADLREEENGDETQL